MVFTGAATVAGTGQFVRRSASDARESHGSAGSRRQNDPNLPRIERGLLDEIVSVGQKNLRSTKRPRSPGGTPLKIPTKPTSRSGNDKLQQALLSKFKTLQSTPVKRQSTASEHLDFSNQWSDANSFEDPDFTTGDITSGLLQVSSPNLSEGFSPSASKTSTPKPGKVGASGSGKKRSGKGAGEVKSSKGVSPNASRKSTAV